MATPGDGSDSLDVPVFTTNDRIPSIWSPHPGPTTMSYVAAAEGWSHSPHIRHAMRQMLGVTTSDDSEGDDSSEPSSSLPFEIPSRSANTSAPSLDVDLHRLGPAPDWQQASWLYNEVPSPPQPLASSSSYSQGYIDPDILMRSRSPSLAPEVQAFSSSTHIDPSLSSTGSTPISPSSTNTDIRSYWGDTFAAQGAQVSLSPQMGVEERSGGYQISGVWGGSSTFLPLTDIITSRLAIDAAGSSSLSVNSMRTVHGTEEFDVATFLDMLHFSPASADRYMSSVGITKSQNKHTLLGEFGKHTRTGASTSNASYGDGWNRAITSDQVVANAQFVINLFSTIEQTYVARNQLRELPCESN